MSIRPATKGWAVLEEFASAFPEGTTRSAVAQTVGCTVQRVGEVVRGNSKLVVIVEGGCYAIHPEAWTLFKGGETDAAVTVTSTKERITTVHKAEPSQRAATDRLAAALEAAEPAEPPASVYKRVMADPAAASDDDFEVAVQFAKDKKRKRPVRP